jgi:clan AA aspartic protease
VIQGSVTSDLEAMVAVSVWDEEGDQHATVAAVVDSGFSGELGLPVHVAQLLGLPNKGRVPMELADGSATEVTAYEGVLDWNGERRRVAIHGTDGGALIGMELLHGSRVSFDVIDGGHVTIEPLP